MPLSKPIKWTAKQLETDVEKATAAFRRERLDEPLELYLEQFDAFCGTFAALIDQLPAFAVHDTGGKATIWHAQFGRANIVVAAVLSGVFGPANCEFVQNEKDVSLFWDHRLADLKKFVAAAR